MSSLAQRSVWWLGGPWAACAVLCLACADDSVATLGTTADGVWRIQADLLSPGADLTSLGDTAAGTVPVCPASPACTCSGAADGATCFAGEPCAVASACQAGTCQVVAVRSCPNLGCQSGACDPSTGECTYHASANGTPCDDGSACTLGDACAAGECAGEAADCNDKSPCTSDTCNPAGGCQHQPMALPCDDGNACTQADACSAAGLCAGLAEDAQIACSDGNPCTTELCNPISGCQHATNSLACNDGDPCTGGDHCSGGYCQPGKQKECACVSDADCWPLDDGNFCNGTLYCDLEVPGHVCAIQSGSVVDCPASPSPCVETSCNPTNGKCNSQVLTGACDDGDACTLQSACSETTCAALVDADCDDGNSCTVDGCDPDSGCWHQPATAGTSCGAGLQCKAGKCLQECKTFEAIIGGPGEDALHAITALKGGLIAVGATNSKGKGGMDGWIVRWDTLKQAPTDWAVGTEEPEALTGIAGYSAYCVVGWRGPAGDTAAWLMATDPTGTTTADVLAGVGENARFNGVVWKEAGCVAVGERTPTAGGKMSEGWIYAVGHGGQLLWQTTAGFQSNDTLLAIRTLDNGYLAAGTSYTAGSGGDGDAWVVRLSGSSEVVWSQQFGTAKYEAGRFLRVQGDHAYIGGTTNGLGAMGYDGYLLAIGLGATPDWQIAIGGSKDDRIQGGAPVPTGAAMLLVGQTEPPGKIDVDGWIVRLDGSGKLHWSKNFGGSSNDWFNAAAPMADGGIAVVGTTGSKGPGNAAGPNGWLLRIDSTASTSCD